MFGFNLQIKRIMASNFKNYLNYIILNTTFAYRNTQMKVQLFPFTNQLHKKNISIKIY